MATPIQRASLRRSLDGCASSLSDDYIDELFAEAGETYTDLATISAQVRVLALEQMFAGSSRQTSYKQNESSESLSDLSPKIKALLDYWKGERDLAVAAGGGGAARFGSTRRRPAIVREYPNG